MRRTLTLSITSLVLLLAGFVGSASADPINSPGVSAPGTLVCGDVTYTVVSPPGPTPAGQMVTANGSNSTRVQIMILDKASAFPQRLLTHCMFTSPEVFAVDLLITPVR
jgi:hypothetical protein